MRAQASPSQDTLTWLIERVIRSAERHELVSPSLQFGRVVLTAVATALLREVHSGTRGMPRKVIWIGMSCSPREASSWQATIPSAESTMDWEPVPFAVPERLKESIIEVLSPEPQDEGLGGGAMLSQLHLPRDAAAIPVLPVTFGLYFRRASIQLPEPYATNRAAWLVGVSELLVETEEGQADHSLMQAERIVGDRLVHGLGSYRPVASILASIDYGFRESLRSARGASGLVQFLEQLDRPIDASVGGKVAESLPVVEDRSPEVTEQLPFDNDAVRHSIQDALKLIYGATDDNPQIKVVSQGRLKTPHGEWNGYAEFSRGLGGLRSTTVLVAVCGSRFEVDEALASYFSKAYTSKETVRLLVLLNGGEAAFLRQYTAAWHKVAGVNFVNLH